MKIIPSHLLRKVLILLALVLGLIGMVTLTVEAASLTLSPATGVYTTNASFTARVVVNTQGKSINAAEGTLTFNPRELSVVSVSRANSIFSLWVTEPTFSNSAGTINFSGGSPTGYAGSGGTIMDVTFRAVGSGTVRASLTGGSVLANDGRGTNILTTMAGGSYTIQAVSSTPVPEVIEYVAPANTPATPVITSNTHSDPVLWYATDEAVLRWVLPAGITGVRTLLDDVPSTIPTRVYESPISEITLSDLPEGISYFHLQFRNTDGWGRVAHYRLGVDTEAPSGVVVALGPDADLASPVQTLKITTDKDTSGVAEYVVMINDEGPYRFEATPSSTVTLPPLAPGYYVTQIEVVDNAGNRTIANQSFTISSFDRPLFTDFPSEINEQVIPVIKGMTRPRAAVDVIVRQVGGEVTESTVVADDTGEFTFIPAGRFLSGVYELTAQATDEYGAQSELSHVIRIAVQEPGYVRFGSLMISALSIIIPLVALLGLLVLSIWYVVLRVRRFRRRVRIESTEALDILHREFSSLQTELRNQETLLQADRKTGKLSKAESETIEALDRALQTAQRRVEKEIEDITNLTSNQT